MIKWFTLIFIVLAILIFLPKIASTPLGKPFFVKALEKKSQSKIAIGSLELSWFGPQKFHQIEWNHDAIAGTVEELEIAAPFWSFSGPFHLKNGSVTYQGGRIDQIGGQIEGNDFQLTGATLQGHLSLKGKIYSKLHFHIQIDVKNFPLIVLGQQLDQILGPTLNLDGFVTLNEGKGTIHLDISAANLKTSLNGFLTEQALTLQDPLTAHIRLTPALSALLLKDANPLFLTSIESNNPVTLRIEPKDFAFPIPFSLEKLKVGQATLDLGQTKCRNGKSLATLIALLKAPDLSNAKQMSAWFTPISFQIDRGIVKTGRMDALLADSIHICTWGDIDLIKDRLKMVLGLPADTLKRSFGIENVPDNYVLKIDVRGSTQEPEILKVAAAAKIAALIAANGAPKKTFFGKFAELFSHSKEEKDVPPPHRPFPWEDGFISRLPMF